MANVTLSISGDSQEVIAVIRSLANRRETLGNQTASTEPVTEVSHESEVSSGPIAPEYRWTAATARDTRNNVSTDAQRLLDVLVSAPGHQLHIDDIYTQLELDRYGLIGARRSISAALRRNADTAAVTLLSTRDRRVTLDSGFAQATLEGDDSTNPMTRWGQLPEYT